MTFVLGLAFLAYLIVITAGCSVLARRLGWVALVMRSWSLV